MRFDVIEAMSGCRSSSGRSIPAEIVLRVCQADTSCPLPRRLSGSITSIFVAFEIDRASLVIEGDDVP